MSNNDVFLLNATSMSNKPVILGRGAIACLYSIVALDHNRTAIKTLEPDNGDLKDYIVGRPISQVTDLLKREFGLNFSESAASQKNITPYKRQPPTISNRLDMLMPRR